MKCIRKDCQNEAQHDPAIGVLPCKSCQAKDEQIRISKAPEFYSKTKQDRVQQDRDATEGDTLYPYADTKGTPDPKFVKQYPRQAKEMFTPEQLKKI